MRRFRLPTLVSLPLLSLLAAQAACSRGAGTSETGVVASVGKAELKSETLARWLKDAPSAPTPEGVGLLLSTWIDQAELATSLQEGKDLTDSTTALQAIQPDAIRGTLNLYWRDRARARPKVSDRSVDSLLARNDIRVFQHLYLDGTKAKDSASVATLVAKARLLLNRLKKGETFTTIVREESQDTATKRNDGYLAALAKDDLPATLQATAWGLEPGEYTGIIPSRLGIHVLRRATAAESRESLRTYLVPRIGLTEDTRFVDSIATARKLMIPKDAVNRTRATAPEPLVVPGTDPIATWDGGGLSPKDLRIWIGMLAPTERVKLAGSADSAVYLFVRETAIRQMLLPIVVPNGPVSVEARATLLPLYHSLLDSALTNVRQYPGKAPGEAATMVTEGLIKGQLRHRPLPGALVSTLRDRYPAKVDTAAVRVIFAKAGVEFAKLHANDSANSAPSLPPAGTTRKP